MYKKAGLLLFVLTSYIGLFAQHRESLDSLLAQLRTVERDTTRVKIYNKISREYYGIDNEKTMLYADSILMLSDSLNYIKGQIWGYFMKGRVYAATGKNIMAIESYNRGIELAKKNGKKSTQAWGYILLSIVYNSLGDFKQAVDYSFEALRIFEEVGNKRGMLAAYINLSKFNIDQYNPEKVKEYNDKALAIALEEKDSVMLAKIYNNIGVYYEDIDTLKALEYYFKALQIHENLGRVPEQILVYNNIGQILSPADEGYFYIMKGLKLSTLYNNVDLMCKGYLGLGRYFHKKRQLDSAVYYYKKVIEITKIIEDNKSLLSAYENLYKIYNEKNNCREALKYHILYTEVKDSVFSKANRVTIANLETNYYLDKKEKELQIAEQQKQYRAILFFATIIVFLFIVGFIVLWLRMKAKKVMLQKDNLLLYKKQLELEIENKNKELTTMVMYLVRKNELMNKVSEKLSKILKDLKISNKKIILEVISQLKREQKNEVWEEFELYFNKVYKGFYENLEKEFPNLTGKDKKLCAFLRLNLSTKDIATITFQNPASIDVARSRLRKKLNLTNKDIELSKFLSQF